MKLCDLSKLSQPQLRFLTATEKFVAYGGARGGGKSWAVRTKAKLLAVSYDGIKILIIRRSFPELLNNHIRQLEGELQGLAKYNKSEKVFHFPNGSLIQFGYCSDEGDLGQYQGAEFDVIFFDEATQLQELWIKQIIACVRGVNDFPKRVYYTCNPGGASHNYFKRLFVDRNFQPGEAPEDHRFIPARVTDNQALMEAQPDYIKQLQALPEKLRKAWLEGRWDIFEGQFFEELRLTPDPDRCAKAGITPERALQQGRFTHVIEPFDLNEGQKRGWAIYRSYDFGYNKPFSVGWWAVDYDGVLYRIAELYGCTRNPDEGVKWTPDQQFQRIREVEQTHPLLKGRQILGGVADPAIWDASRGESIAQTAARYGIYFTPGDNRRIPGWMQLHYRLQFDHNGYPGLYVFSTCKAFIRTMPQLLYSATNPEDLDTSLEDHCADEVRYFCMSRPIRPVLPRTEPEVLADPLR